MVLKGKKVYKSLKKKGFIDSKNHSNDHKYLELYYEGKFIIYTKLSHGSKKDIGIHLIKQMSSQCKLSKKDFEDLVNCPLSEDDYILKLKEQDIVI